MCAMCNTPTQAKMLYALKGSTRIYAYTKLKRYTQLVSNVKLIDPFKLQRLLLLLLVVMLVLMP